LRIVRANKLATVPTETLSGFIHPSLKTDQPELVSNTYWDFSEGEDDAFETCRVSLNSTVVVPRFDLSLLDTHFNYNNPIAVNAATVYVPNQRFAVDLIFNIVGSTSAHEPSIAARVFNEHENKIFKRSISKYIVISSCVLCIIV